MKAAYLTVLVSFSSILAAAPTAAPSATQDDQLVKLEPLAVYGESTLSFGFGVRVVRTESSRTLLEMTVDRVQTDSDAERKGLKPGSRIIAINGRPVSEYEATFSSGSELSRIFVGRHEGDSVNLQVMIPGKKKATKLTIVRRTVLYDRTKIGGLPTN